VGRERATIKLNWMNITPAVENTGQNFGDKSGLQKHWNSQPNEKEKIEGEKAFHDGSINRRQSERGKRDPN